MAETGSNHEKGDREHHNNEEPSTIGRRRFLGTSVAAPLVGLFGGMGTAAASERAGSGPEDPTPLPPGKRPFGHKPTSYREISGKVKELTPHWILLTADKDTTLEYLHAADQSSEITKHLEGLLHDTWREYPLKRVKRGNTTYIVPEEMPPSEVGTHKQFEGYGDLGLGEVARSVAEGLDKLREQRIGITWSPATHRDMAFRSCKRMGYNDSNAGIARDYADDPDYWTANVPNWLSQGFKNFISQVVHSWEHYHNPGLIGYGDAPAYASNYLNQARTSYRSGGYTTAYRDLGYAIHFVSDVGQPLHTGAELSQALNQWVHFDYESYVASNWTSGKNFASIYDSSGFYYAIQDPGQGTKDLASYSNSYCGEVYQTIYENPNTWQSLTRMKTITDNVLLKTALYVKGFAWYVRN